ncbi:MAG: hypothetical protein ACOCQR_02050 [bacterium]
MKKILNIDSLEMVSDACKIKVVENGYIDQVLQDNWSILQPIWDEVMIEEKDYIDSLAIKIEELCVNKKQYLKIFSEVKHIGAFIYKELKIKSEKEFCFCESWETKEDFFKYLIAFRALMHRFDELYWQKIKKENIK